MSRFRLKLTSSFAQERQRKRRQARLPSLNLKRVRREYVICETLPLEWILVSALERIGVFDRIRIGQLFLERILGLQIYLPP